MLVEWHWRNVRVPAEVHESVERRLRFALGRFADRIRNVRVRVDDVNGSRGGIDKQCTAEALVAGAGRLVVNVADAEIEPAVSRAADRLARQVADELRRRRDLRRRGPRRVRNPE